MSAKTHALLSASSATRWINCPPSARLCENQPDKPSEYAEEGTQAHALCEYKLREYLGENVQDPTENLSKYNSEMEESAKFYLHFASSMIELAREKTSDAKILVEQRVDFSEFVPDGFGTADLLIVFDKEIIVVDFKYGKGVKVDAEMNPQMMCYALGALQMFDDLYEIEKVTLFIVQPRMTAISDFEISKTDLLTWAEKILKPAAKSAFDGEGEFKAGEHCRFCKVKAKCRKRAEYNLELAKYDFQMPSTLEDSEIEMILEKADSLASWVSDVQEYALKAALQGKKWQGWKVVEGRSNRQYTDEKAVEKIVRESGFEPCEKKLLGITAMTKMLGSKKFNDLLKDYVEKPQGKPTLVPASDKRSEWNSAVKDFETEDK